ncbi:hypothetical protein PSHT_04578 [Puccinia striiformis]|uniref:Glutamine amidotransferase type-2 domain-containing protein n=3 Tax=Puccinia striiformis TaxID=27350 RepID=A0A0L0UW86_9BASI|nr:hypothetical protein KEM48_007279 [Puccinia striiformis f. sp. tritici PST-130]KNE91201.1 hypothetical protein PSTG_15365 [Puccinia striiformis f. sp. tritici PST-78]POW15746.1 hypothetical protein PSTT_01912 [Puccinia striiformis]POW19548.1 hypothetical protein PSHT_04578 [Puccinia striiformis]
MGPAKSPFYQWTACVMAPWHSPALFTFPDGHYGANLERNVGAIMIAPKAITRKGRLESGEMLLVNT